MKLDRIKRVLIDGVIYDVHQEFKDTLDPDGYTAVEINGTIYPVITRMEAKYPYSMGVYKDGVLICVKRPKDNKIDKYVMKNIPKENIVDFNDVNSMTDLIDRNREANQLESNMLTNTNGNIFAPPILDTDLPEMAGLKEAIIKKKINLENYASRVGDNFNNDKRLFNKNTMTLNKIRDWCDALDIKATLILEDANENVPNPMNTIVEKKLTQLGENDDN